MKIYILVWTAILYSASLSSLPAQDSKDSLWGRAVEIFSQNDDWVPGLINGRFELLNSQGDVTDLTLSQTKLVLNQANQVESQIIQVIHNGQDVTAKSAAENSSEEDGEKQEFSFEESPFNPEIQDRVSVRLTDERIVIDGKPCVIYEYSLLISDQTRSGKIWLDTLSGVPVQNEFTQEPLPKHVKKLINRIFYRCNADGSFYVDKISFEGSGGFLLIKKNFRGEMIFSNYWRWDRNSSKSNNPQ
ncbi:MAG: hypothetical protein EHM72_15610 [Calditrichaeota bacterium]|nr:MAG: hypothetical protein EHM72_15610 [Calditrichota bacterium]